MKKGLIALDIDGTTTPDLHSIPQSTVSYLRNLVSLGWDLAFITGRSFKLASSPLQSLNFPYHLGVYNGGIILKMPERKIVHKQYLNSSIFDAFEKICKEEPTDFSLYTGCENGDICYYRPHKFSSDLLEYVEKRVIDCKERWEPVESYESLPFMNFVSIKCFGVGESSKRIQERIESEVGLHAPMILDPYHQGYYVIQATHPEVNKGTAVQHLKSLLQVEKNVIAAGDDYNDVSMLNEADIKIVMEGAPGPVKQHADIIAGSAQKEGIIQALEEAIQKC